MLKHILLGLGAASLLVVVTALPVQADNIVPLFTNRPLLGHEVPTNLIVNVRGTDNNLYQWVWASPCAGTHDTSALEKSCGSDYVLPLGQADPKPDPLVYLHHGFGIATDDDWNKSFPDPTPGTALTDLDNEARRETLISVFTPDRFTVPASCAAPYFSYAYNDCKVGNVFAGAIWKSPLALDDFRLSSGSQTFLVKQIGENGSVPEPSSLLLLGAGLLGLAAWRWKRTA
ncbi:MAG: PEP-CTERM sorting domain-containing protein [Nitrospira sp.]|nr:MAG: PEP-CTERM sorting domain-containing protein [Nitrospira sp.]